ncbi:MAG: tryptophan synthase subunit beta, partial [Actinomycetota bacterium]|nr:tryptophan synthase subunit beta [Actinomycetota bacterium]
MSAPSRAGNDVEPGNNAEAGNPAEIPGRFGPYGGRYVPEALVAALDELADAYASAKADPAFREALWALQRDYSGRPTPITEARRLSEHAGGGRIVLKREDLNHTGSHKINNVLGQS